MRESVPQPVSLRLGCDSKNFDHDRRDVVLGSSVLSSCHDSFGGFLWIRFIAQDLTDHTIFGTVSDAI